MFFHVFLVLKRLTSIPDFVDAFPKKVDGITDLVDSNINIFSFYISFNKIGGIRKNIQVNLMLFRSFALSFHKIGGARE